jgi:hypothetical protein
MAAHGEIEYATADGNDLPAHEAGYAEFIEAIFIGATCVVTILFGLAVGGVLGYWLPGGLVILAAAIAHPRPCYAGDRGAHSAVDGPQLTAPASSRICQGDGVDARFRCAGA